MRAPPGRNWNISSTACWAGNPRWSAGGCRTMASMPEDWLAAPDGSGAPGGWDAGLRRRLAEGAGSVLAYLWSGWGAVASLLLLCALWEWGGQYYGPLILPGPRATFERLGELLASGQA